MNQPITFLVVRVFTTVLNILSAYCFNMVKRVKVKLKSTLYFDGEENNDCAAVHLILINLHNIPRSQMYDLSVDPVKRLVSIDDLYCSLDESLKLYYVFRII